MNIGLIVGTKCKPYFIFIIIILGGTSYMAQWGAIGIKILVYN